MSIPKAVIYQFFEGIESVGERVAQARRVLGLLRREDIGIPDLARLLDVKPETVRTWEAGEKRPRDARLSALAAMIGVHPSVIHYGDVPESAVAFRPLSGREESDAKER